MRYWAGATTSPGHTKADHSGTLDRPGAEAPRLLSALPHPPDGRLRGLSDGGPVQPVRLVRVHAACLVLMTLGGSTGQFEGTYLLSIPEDRENTEAAIEYEADFIARTIRHAAQEGVDKRLGQSVS